MPFVQVQNKPKPPVAQPLIDGTYLILNVRKSIACGGNEGAQFLSRQTNCETHKNLFTSDLNSANALEDKWEIALVEGMHVMVCVCLDKSHAYVLVCVCLNKSSCSGAAPIIHQDMVGAKASSARFCTVPFGGACSSTSKVTAILLEAN